MKAICKQLNNENVAGNLDFFTKFASGSENVCFILILFKKDKGLIYISHFPSFEISASL